MMTHFPESLIVSETDSVQIEEPKVMDSSSAAWKRSKGMFDCKKVKWAINSFQPHKSPGPDQIFPALLQRGLKTQLPTLVLMFRTSYALGYLPKAWREVKVVYIPKAGKKDPEQPKSYRPISLTSFILKTMEKLIDLHIRTKHLIRQPLHSKQFAYQAGKSTISALHHLVRKIENAIKYKEVALAAFIDVEGAFDNTGFDSIRAAAQSRHIGPETVEWIIQMLERRIVIARLGEEEIAIKTTKGCPQGGVLSPRLWSLVIDNRLIELEQQGYEVLGFADDLVIIVRGKVDSLISVRLQFALNYATKWCRRTKLNINPRKTIVIPFTRRLKLGLKDGDGRDRD
jgi:Reverse transcriptase (RNA-dependent DNA polymerase)